MTDEGGRSGSPGWRLLRRTIWSQKGGIAIGMLAALGWTAARVSIPRLVQAAIDRGITGEGRLLWWAVAIAVAGAASGVFLGLRRYLAFRNARLAEVQLRDQLFAHIQRLHFAYHDTNATGDLMSRANTDLQQFQNFLTMIPITTGNALMVVAVLAIMLTAQPVLTVLALIGLPAVNVLGRRFSQRLHPAVLGIQRESAQLATVVEETITGIRVVKGFGAEAVQARKLEAEAQDVFDQSLLASRIRSRYLPAIELLPNLGIVVVLGYGGHLVLNDAMSVGELVSFNIYVLMLIQPLRMLGMVVANGQRAAAAGERIDEVLSTAPLIIDPPDPVPLPRCGRLGRVELRGVRFGYHDGRNDAVLDGLDLVVEPGEAVAIVGPTGVGKSTVARLLPRFYDVDAGVVLLDGVDVRRVRRRELRQAVSIVFEETVLFSGTVAENIAFAQPEASRAQIVRAARLAGAAEFVQELPNGFDTLLGERGFSLSGGQRQRLAIARAILADPRVLVLDDATSAVDPTKEHEIRDALGEVMAGRTTIVIAHRPATIALADRVVLLDGGRVAAEGTHQELLATVPRYREVLAAESAVAG